MQAALVAKQILKICYYNRRFRLSL